MFAFEKKENNINKTYVIDYSRKKRNYLRQRLSLSNVFDIDLALHKETTTLLN